VVIAVPVLAGIGAFAPWLLSALSKLKKWMTRRKTQVRNRHAGDLMDVIEAIQLRKSIRKFKATPIPRAVLGNCW